MAFSPDSQTLFSGGTSTGSTPDPTVKIWNVATGELQRSIPAHEKGSVRLSLSSDGQTVATISPALFPESPELKLWDTETGALRVTCKSPHAKFTSVAYNPTMESVVTGDVKGTLVLWDAVSGRKKWLTPGHKNNIQALAFSPDGRLIASGSTEMSAEGNLSLWDAASGEKVRALRGYNSYIGSIAFLRNRSALVTGSYDRTIRLWDSKTGKTLDRMTHPQNSPSVRMENLSLFDNETKVAFVGNGGSRIRQWDLQKSQLISNSKNHNAQVFGVSISPDGQVLASGSGDGTIKLWDLKSDTLITTLGDASKSVLSLEFSPDGSVIASLGIGSDGTIRLWKPGQRNPWKSLFDDQDQYHDEWSLAFRSGTNLIASAGYSDFVKLWDLEQGRQVATLNRHKEKHGIYCARFSPDGNLLASCSSDGKIQFWDFKKQRASIIKVGTEMECPRIIAFSNSGKLLAAGSVDGIIRLYNVRSQEMVGEILAHHIVIGSMHFSPDDRFLVVSAIEGRNRNLENRSVIDINSRVAVIDVKKRKIYGRIRFEPIPHAIHCVRFTPDGRFIATANPNGTVSLIPFRDEQGNLLPLPDNRASKQPEAKIQRNTDPSESPRPARDDSPKKAKPDTPALRRRSRRRGRQRPAAKANPDRQTGVATTADGLRFDGDDPD